VKVCCLSDLHGHLPEVPDCDLLVLAGDYCRDHADAFWYRDAFAPWVDRAAGRMKIVGVAGNHDFIFERAPHMVPRMNWAYLQDSGVEWGGLKIYGSPWQPRFFDWAFNADEPDLKKRWDAIPADTDILVLHGPPYGHGDFSPYGRVHTGSMSLLTRIEAVQPRLVVAGHIHSGYGTYRIGKTLFVNASLVDEAYRPVNAPIVVEI
jgi:Icc-related predicted phosphoesterase